jgi:hypothetical protein
VTRALAIEYAKEGIRVNTVALGTINTPMHKPEAHEFLKGLHPIGRMGEVKEVVDAVLFLIDATFTTGEILRRWRRARRQMVTREGSRPASAELRLKELGIELPAPPEPFGTYLEGVQTDNLLFLTGMLPTEGRAANGEKKRDSKPGAPTRSPGLIYHLR